MQPTRKRLLNKSWNNLSQLQLDHPFYDQILVQLGLHMDVQYIEILITNPKDCHFEESNRISVSISLLAFNSWLLFSIKYMV